MIPPLLLLVSCVHGSPFEPEDLPVIAVIECVPTPPDGFRCRVVE